LKRTIPKIEQDVDLMVCWMNQKKLLPGTKYIIRHTTKETKCIVKELVYKLDINTLHRVENAADLGLNDIGRIKIRTAQPLFFDSYRKIRATGCIILIDEQTKRSEYLA
jgi:sulfate adenylyltransferase subunit 1